MNEQALDYRTQGATMMGLGKFEEAKNYFLKALEIEKDSQIYTDLGNAYANLNELDNAIDAFNNALLLDPNNGELLFEIGSTYLLQDRLTRCIEYYNKSEAAGYDNVRLFINMAAIYRALGDKQMELRSYSKAINLQPLMSENYVKKIMLFIELNRFEEALETLEDLRKLFPDAFEGYDLAARIYSGQGNTASAIAILKEGIERFPEDINLMNSLVSQYVAMNDKENAVEWLNKIKASQYAVQIPKAILMQEIGIASLDNDTEKMYVLLDEALKYDKDGMFDEQIHFMMMNVSMLLEKYEKALEMATALEEQNSESPFYVSGLYYKGDILEKLGKTEEAEKQFRKAARKLRVMSTTNRTTFEVYIFRALAHRHLKEYDKAIEIGEYLVELNEDRADGHIVLADTYKAMGNEEKSAEEFAKAKAIDANL